jgi:hypothetical protein
VHPDDGTGLTTLAGRDTFRASLPPGTDMEVVNSEIAEGCSETWIQTHLP